VFAVARRSGATSRNQIYVTRSTSNVESIF
jgi:hypothetical protein